MPNYGSLSHPHGLEEAHVVHRPDPGGQIQKISSRGRSPACPLLSHQILVLIGPAISESIRKSQPDQSLLPQGSLRSPWDQQRQSPGNESSCLFHPFSSCIFWETEGEMGSAHKSCLPSRAEMEGTEMHPPLPALHLPSSRIFLQVACE